MDPEELRRKQGYAKGYASPREGIEDQTSDKPLIPPWTITWQNPDDNAGLLLCDGRFVGTIMSGSDVQTIIGKLNS